MKRIADDIFQWSVFSEEKQLDFNGTCLVLGDLWVLIDPPPLNEAGMSEMEETLGAPDKILITNRHHRRASFEFRKKFGAPIHVHAADRGEIGIQVDGTFAHEDEVAPGLFVVSVPDSKTPGESAFHWRDRKVLVIGDALIGKPEGELSLLPPEKFRDVDKARDGIHVLAELDLEIVLVGDGAPILSEGTNAIRKFLHAA